MIKKSLILIIQLLLSIEIMGQKVIQMEKDGGVYKISCTVNGAKMKMIFDTGASNVSISMAMANYLFENDYITAKDILGTGSATVANGAIVNTTIINLRDIEISGIHIKDIQAIVTEGQNVPLLFGQSAIKKLGSYTINGNMLILNNHQNEYITEEENDELINTIIQSINNQQYYLAIEKLKKLESTIGLGPYGYALLTRCYVHTKQYESAVDAGELGLSKPEISDQDKKTIYIWISMAYEGICDNNNCIKYSELLLQYQTNYKDRYFTYNQIAWSYKNLQNIVQAEYNYKKAAQCIMQYYNNNAQDIFLGKINNQELGECLYSLALLHEDNYYYDNYMRLYAVLGAMCRNTRCIGLCNQYNIDYLKDAKKMYKHVKSINNFNLFD